MRLIQRLLLPATILLLAGCDQHDHAAHQDHASPVHEQTQEITLTLNDGKKWESDGHTREMIEKIDRVLATRHPSTPAEYQETARELKQMVDQLIAGCTMEGPSHDQLHLFLARLIPAIDTLGKAGDKETAETYYRKLQQLLDTYHQHFE